MHVKKIVSSSLLSYLTGLLLGIFMAIFLPSSFKKKLPFFSPLFEIEKENEGVVFEITP